MEFEAIVTEIPGPHSRRLAEALRAHESRGVTYVAGDFPIFWESAQGALVTDVDGNRFIDLTSAFGVATVGHTNAAVVAALEHQSRELLHGLGDVHPTRVRVQLLAELARIAPGRLEKSFLCSSGSEAVDFALKTAYLRSKKAGIVAFEGSYHGLASSALSVTGIERFRAPFAPFVTGDVRFVPFPAAHGASGAAAAALHAVETELRGGSTGAVIVEPIQGRAGVIVPPDGFLRGLRELCTQHGAVLIFDEIYTGFGRTGTTFACEHEGVEPDLMCVGKAIAGGMPLAAVIGTAAVMNAWAPSSGEALHTSTYLGNPLACAASLAVLRELETQNVAARAAELGAHLGARLERLRRHPWVTGVRGRGMLWGIEMSGGKLAFEATKEALRSGVIVLPSGVQGNVISLSPPVVIEERQLTRAVSVLEEAMVRVAAPGERR
jgi:4-aminobutyrate aminotransferase-like enzyme